MKFRKLGRIALATAASLFIGFGTQSCYYYTEAYIIVTGSQYNQVASYREQNQTGILTQAPHSPLSSGGDESHPRCAAQRRPVRLCAQRGNP